MWQFLKKEYLKLSTDFIKETRMTILRKFKKDKVMALYLFTLLKCTIKKIIKPLMFWEGSSQEQ